MCIMICFFPPPFGWSLAVTVNRFCRFFLHHAHNAFPFEYALGSVWDVFPTTIICTSYNLHRSCGLWFFLFVISIEIPSNLHGHLPGWKFDRKNLHSWKIWNFGVRNPSAAITGLYRVFAVTLAIRWVVGWKFAGKSTVLVRQTGKITDHRSSFTPRYSHFIVIWASTGLFGRFLSVFVAIFRGLGPKLPIFGPDSPICDGKTRFAHHFFRVEREAKGSRRLNCKLSELCVYPCG